LAIYILAALAAAKLSLFQLPTDASQLIVNIKMLFIANAVSFQFYSLGGTGKRVLNNLNGNFL